MVRLYRDTGQPLIQHISETGQDAIIDSEFDHVIINNYGLKDLKAEVYQRILPYLRNV
jgi:hypothetical protein